MWDGAYKWHWPPTTVPHTRTTHTPLHATTPPHARTPLQTITLLSALLGKTGLRAPDERPPEPPAGTAAAAAVGSSGGSSSAAAAIAAHKRPPPLAPYAQAEVVVCAPSYAPALAPHVPGAPVLVLVPPAVRSNWQRELSQWGWFRVRDLGDVKGVNAREKAEGRARAVDDVVSGRADVLLCGHEMALRDAAVYALLQPVRWGMLVVE
jgi:hypothetical protein